MKILITGASGYIGQNIILKLMKKNHSLVLLSRRPDQLKELYGDIHTYIQWDALAGPPPKDAFNNIDAIINLMGEGVAEKRWSKKQKQKIYDTRVLGTKNLVSGVINHKPLLKVFVSASAIGFYNHVQPKDLTIQSPAAKGFLGELCKDWESASEKINQIEQVRRVIIRIGIVLGEKGALAKMKLPFILGLGGKVGTGDQWMNWVHIEDISNLFVAAIENNNYSGIYNGVSTGNVTNEVFTRALGSVLNRPTIFSVPSFAIKLLVGELSQEILQGQRVRSAECKSVGFKFKFEDIHLALEDALNIKYIPHLKQKVRCERIHVMQYINQSPEKVFSFFSDATNLERITPSFLNFKILSQSTPNIESGTVFNYKLRVRGIPLKWQSLILDWTPISLFSDTQTKGPYRVWHHTHHFTPIKSGTLIEDDVYFAIPRIPLIDMVAIQFVSRDVKSIFNHRKKMIPVLFNE
ncbi:TIGR01777 family protein [Candidatus Marinamargulisbacteria bacterium SCGC AG-410-N11]|nr:TIGR01777 family protein [Candidatus Marinamargulisbacteria bacterium SCGC AG-410-N11]